MKISVDGVELFTLSETQKKVIQHDIHADIFDEDMKRRLQYIVMHKFERCFERLKKEWEGKLADSGIEFIPTSKEAFAEMVFALPEYKNRAQRDAQESEK